MDEKPKPSGDGTKGSTPPEPPRSSNAPREELSQAAIALQAVFARPSSVTDAVPERIDRPEHSVMEGLPSAKAERIASVYRELAELKRQLSAAQERAATELQARAEDAERIETLETHLQAQEQNTQKAIARVAELESELTKLRTQLEDGGRQHREASEQLDVHRKLLQEAKAAAETREAELATRTGQYDTELASRTRLERELEEARKQREERETELAARTSEVDALKGEVQTAKGEADKMKEEVANAKGEVDKMKEEVDKARAELEAGRTKARELASQFAKFGQEIESAGFVMAHMERPGRSQPPPLPPARPSQPKVETIVAVVEDPKQAPSGMRSGLMLVGGAIVGAIVTIVIVMLTHKSDATTANNENPPPAALTVPESQPKMPEETPTHDEPVAAAPVPAGQPTPAPGGDVQPSATPAGSATEGVIVLPTEADGHRVFVDGKKIDVKGSRAVVPCGARVIQIGSQGSARKIDVACGAETTIPADTVDR